MKNKPKKELHVRLSKKNKTAAAKMTDLEASAWAAIILSDALDYRDVIKQDGAGENAPDVPGYTRGMDKLLRRVGHTKALCGGDSRYDEACQEVLDETDSQDEFEFEEVFE